MEWGVLWGGRESRCQSCSKAACGAPSPDYLHLVAAHSSARRDEGNAESEWPFAESKSGLEMQPPRVTGQNGRLIARGSRPPWQLASARARIVPMGAQVPPPRGNATCCCPRIYSLHHFCALARLLRNLLALGILIPRVPGHSAVPRLARMPGHDAAGEQG